MSKVKAICNFSYAGEDIKQGTVLEVAESDLDMLLRVEAVIEVADEEPVTVEAASEPVADEGAPATPAPLEETSDSPSEEQAATPPVETLAETTTEQPANPTPEQIAQDLALENYSGTNEQAANIVVE
jgi:hypothetical protein